MADRVSERVLEVSGLRLACKLWGDASGLPSLALHGWLDNAASFDALAARLPQLRLCALDLPGHGLSEHRPSAASYHFVDYVADVLAAADALEWPRFALIGHSLGAGIATLLAAVAPERILRAVLIEGLGPSTSPPEDAPAVLRRALADSQRPERSPGTVYATFEDAVRARMGGIGRLSEPAARALCERGLERVAQGYRWRNDRRLRAGSRLRMSEAHALAFIRDMTVPTLLIRADPGLSVNARAQEARVAAHPDLRVERMAGSHHLHMEEPSGRVAELIAAFIVNRAAAPATERGYDDVWARGATLRGLTMTERKSNRRDEKLEAAGINRREWVAKAIALAGMHGTGTRRPQGKRAAKREDEAPEAEDADESET